MKNYTLYENLNLYFPNEQYENITNSIDEILTLAQLQDYKIGLEKADYRLRFISLSVTKHETNEFIALVFDYKINDKLHIFTSMDLYHENSSDAGPHLISSGVNLIEILNEAKSLL